MGGPLRENIIVVGAGASAEFKLPAGAELKKKIASVLDFSFNDSQIKGGDTRIAKLLFGSRSKKCNEYMRACRAIKASMPLSSSIDRYIYNRRNAEIVYCSKLAIVCAILTAEAQSTIFYDQTNLYNKLNFSTIENTWLTKLFRILTDHTNGVDELSKKLKRLCFIVFNYDRCIEHFFFNAFKLYYDVNDAVAAGLVKSLEIIHPYGSVGALPWQSSSQSSVAFGNTNAEDEELRALSGQIKTFTESTDDPDVHKVITHARTILFLGCAYHKMNLDVLSKGPPEDKYACLYCTRKGISDEDFAKIDNMLQHKFGKKATYKGGRNEDCSKFFENLGRCIAADLHLES